MGIKEWKEKALDYDSMNRELNRQFEQEHPNLFKPPDVSASVFVPQKSRTPQGTYTRREFTPLFWVLVILIVVGLLAIRIASISPLFG